MTEAGDGSATAIPLRYRVRKPRPSVNLVLFVLTLASTLYWGFLQYQAFYRQDLPLVTANPLAAPQYLLNSAPFAMAVLAFLLAHEMGHYLTCRFYGVAATLPYFIPMPPVIGTLLPGTMGAVIRIVSPIRSRRALFDIAVAGPIAGFVVALPILAVGLSQSRVVDTLEIETSGTSMVSIGEPLLWQGMRALFGPETAANQDLLMHPLAFVGWFALLVTAMNLLPVGQLDGGHILYAFLPRQHRWISLGMLVAMLYAGWRYFLGWFVFAVIIFFMLGTRHPRPPRFEQELGGMRIFLALLAVAIFATCIVLVPVTLPGL